MIDPKKNELVQNDELAFEQEVMESVHGRVRPSGTKTEIYNVGMQVTSNLKRIASLVTELYQDRTDKDDLTDSRVENYLKSLVILRGLQLVRRAPKTIDLRDIPVPDFFRPFLAHITKLETPYASLELVPVWTDGDVDEVEDGVEAQGIVSEALMETDELLSVARRLKAAGVRCTKGFPRSLVSCDDSIFRVCEDAEGNLLIAGGEVTDAVVLVRSVIRLAFLDGVYGDARTRYLSVEDCRFALEILVERAFDYSHR